MRPASWIRLVRDEDSVTRCRDAGQLARPYGLWRMKSDSIHSSAMARTRPFGLMETDGPERWWWHILPLGARFQQKQRVAGERRHSPYTVIRGDIASAPAVRCMPNVAHSIDTATASPPTTSFDAAAAWRQPILCRSRSLLSAHETKKTRSYLLKHCATTFTIVNKLLVQL